MALSAAFARVMALMGAGAIPWPVSDGRPVDVAIGHDHRSLLVADDVGDVIWRLAAA